jgi:hypothetical protein
MLFHPDNTFLIGKTRHEICGRHVKHEEESG